MKKNIIIPFLLFLMTTSAFAFKPYYTWEITNEADVDYYIELRSGYENGFLQTATIPAGETQPFSGVAGACLKSIKVYSSMDDDFPVSEFDQIMCKHRNFIIDSQGIISKE